MISQVKLLPQKYGSFGSVSTAPKTHKSQDFSSLFSQGNLDVSPAGFSGKFSSSKSNQNQNLDKIIEVDDDKLEDTVVNDGFSSKLIKLESTKLSKNLLGELEDLLGPFDDHQISVRQANPSQRQILPLAKPVDYDVFKGASPGKHTMAR